MKKQIKLGILIKNLEEGINNSQKLLLEKFDENFNIKIFTLSSKNKDYEQEKIVPLDINLDDSFIKFPINYYNIINDIKKLKTRHNIDKCISFGKRANMLNVLSKNNEEVIIDVEDVIDDSFVLDKFIKRMYKKSDKIIVNSKKKKNYLKNEYKLENKKISVIDDILPIDYISNQAAQKIDDNLSEFFKNNIIINTGDLIEQKGQWHLIKAFYRIKEKFNNTKLLIVGDGPLNKDLNTLIKNMNMEEEIKIINNEDNPYKYLIRSDIYVMSSHIEQDKKQILDAMSCARPVISTTCFDEIINVISPQNYVQRLTEPFYGEYGILVPVADNSLNINSKVLNKNEIVLSNAIIKLLNDYEVYDNYMEQSAKRAISYSKENIYKEWEKILN